MGPPGPPGVVNVVALAGTGSADGLPANSPPVPNFAFLGNTAHVSIEAGQQIVATASFSVAGDFATGVIRYALCYQPTGGSVTLFEPGIFLTGAYPKINYDSMAVSGTVVLGVAGDYDVGLCARNASSTSLLIERVIGVVMVVNPPA